MRLYAKDHGVKRDEALAALTDDASARKQYAEEARALADGLRDTNDRITALQTVALERDMPDALCTGFVSTY